MMEKKLSRKEILSQINEILLITKLDGSNLAKHLGTECSSSVDIYINNSLMIGQIQSKLSILLAKSLGLDSSHWDDDFSQYLK